MKRALLLALVACGKHAEEPAPKKDAAAVVAATADAAPRPDASPPPAKPRATQIAVGGHLACALLSDGSVRCWEGDAVTTPNLRGVKQLVVGDAYACAIVDDASVACWGKIGFGAQAQQAVPTGVPGVRKVKLLWAVGPAACASDVDGKLACWGDVDPRGHFTHSGAHRTPTAVVGLDHVKQLVAHAALRDDGDVAFWEDGGAPTRAGVTGVLELADDPRYACGRRADGAECYGPDQPCAPAEVKPVAPKPKKKPAKGKATKAPPPKPAGPRIEKLALLPAKRFGAADGLCEITTAGRVQCVHVGEQSCGLVTWGRLTDVVELAGSCARIANGTVRCWTDDPKHRDSTAIAGVAGATALSATGDRACAIVEGGAVACWTGIAAAKPIDL